MRRLIINIHLYLAAFFAPVLLLVVISGGGYLLDFKGHASKQSIAVASGATLDLKSLSLEADVAALLTAAGESADFEYLRVGTTSLVTRPTSTVHYQIGVADGEVSITRVSPDWQYRIVELHKGHGPMLFKNFQKLLALGLLFIVISGLWLGLSSRMLRVPSALAAVSGLLVMLVLVFS